jgi:hypothetical protein
VRDVEHVTVTGLVAPGRLLSCAQTLARIGDRMVGIQSLLCSVEQMNAPGVGVAMFGRGKQIAVGRSGVDTGEHRLGALEDFVMQADTNLRQILAAVDCAGLLRGRLVHSPQEISNFRTSRGSVCPRKIPSSQAGERPSGWYWLA